MKDVTYIGCSILLFIQSLFFVYGLSLPTRNNNFALSVTCDREQDSLVLINIYDVLDGENWDINTNWNTSEPIHTWHGIFDVNEDGCIDEIILINNNWNGVLPNSIGRLKSLRKLEIKCTIASDCNLGLVGELPDSLGNLENLEELHLLNNNISGIVPSNLLSLPNLQKLVLTSNHFDSLPDVSSLINNSLDNVFVEGNELTFDDILPYVDSINNFYYNNQDSIFVDTTLFVREGHTLTINLGIDKGISNNVYTWSRNQDSITTLTSNTLNINNIQLNESGTYKCQVRNPQAPNLVLHSNSIEVIVRDCRFVDSLILVDFYEHMGGDNWSTDTVVTYFNLGIGKYFNDTIKNYNNPWDFNEPIDTWRGVELNSDGCVKHLILPNRGLAGELPNSLSNLEGLEKLYLPENEISGFILESLYTLNNLKELSLSKNNIGGTIDSDISNLSNLIALDLRNNDLKAGIPEEIGELTGLRRLFLSENPLGGNIPNSVTRLTELRQLDLNNNELSGSLPDSIGLLKNLAFLFLYNNNELSGSIPNSFTELEALVQCEIYLTSIDGELPESFGDLQNLSILILNRNQLEGVIPESFEDLINLRRLDLSSNQFTGASPDLSHLPFLQRLWIDDNLFESFPNHGAITTWNDTQGCKINNNHLTFDDILPTHATIPDTVNWQFENQNPIFGDSLLQAVLGQPSLTINLYIDESVPDNIYEWFKDGIPLVKSDTLVITNSNNLALYDIQLSDAGIYSCKVTNPSIDTNLMTLYSRGIAVEVMASTDINNTKVYNPFLTPNGDGINDILKFNFLSDYADNKLVVFNRYGRIVFESSSYNNDWRGIYQKTGEQLPYGTYFYILKLNEDKSLKGYITLLNEQ